MEQLQNPYSIIVSYLENIASTQTDILTRMNRVLNNVPAIQEDELVTEQQAKKIVKASRVTMLKWRKAGQLEVVRFGKSIRYRKSDLLKLSQSRKVKTNHL